MSEPPDPPIPRPQPLQFGELARGFVASTQRNPRFFFESLGGVWMVLAFFGSVSVPFCREALDEVLARRGRFDDADAYFFGVTTDPADLSERRVSDLLPGIRFFRDFDRKVSELYGASDGQTYTPVAFLLDRTKRLVEAAPVRQIGRLLDRLERELAEEAKAAEGFAPVLVAPRVFEPEFCRALIDYYARFGGAPSGTMNEVDGVTVGRLDAGYKRRTDATIEDPALVAAARQRVTDRLLPLVQRTFGWRATRIERFIVACYSDHDQGFFLPHRDNTTPGTAHRKFAVTINLNPDEYEGGELRFPEFGRRTYKAPLGGAVVFGCGLLHEATRVTRGVRYAFLPFLYDEEGKRIRDANAATVVHAEPAAAPV